MENQITVFSNEQFGQVRTVEVNGEMWFVGKDIATILGYKNISDALTKFVDEDDRINSKTQSQITIELGLGQRGGWLINESGLYSLILSSKLPTAKEFKKWVTSEVLPSIRKHGMYMTDEVWLTMMTDPTKFGEILIAYGKEKAEKQKALEVIEAQRPKVEYHDEVLNSKGLFTTTQVAKDFGLSAIKLNNILHEQEIQYKQSGQWLLYSKYQDMQLTQSCTTTFENSNGETVSKMNTKWTNKGRKFIWKLLKQIGYEPTGKEAISYINED